MAYFKSPEETEFEKGLKLGHKWIRLYEDGRLTNIFECANKCGARVETNYYNDAPESMAIEMGIGPCKPKT